MINFSWNNRRNLWHFGGFSLFSITGILLTLATALQSYGAEPPVITSGPTNFIGASGRTAVFSVTAESEDPITFQWFKDDEKLADTERILGSKSSRLSICPLETKDIGGYSVVVSNAYGAVTNGPAMLELDLAQPRITSRPADFSGAPGDAAEFHCNVESDQMVHLQWYKGETAIADGDNISGATSTTLLVDPVTHTDAGWYSLKAKSWVGTVWSKPAFLKVSESTDHAVALDYPGAGWSSTGEQPWSVQSDVTHDGIDALRAGAIDHSESSTIETTITGPGVLTFYWKVSSEPGYDKLSFSLNGETEFNISGSVDWEQKTVVLKRRTYTAQWTYSKDGSNDGGDDTAYLDQVGFTPIKLTSIAEGLDNEDLILSTGGDAMWFGQLDTANDGIDSAQAGLISHGQSTFIETTVAGPGVISFAFKASSELSFDSLEFLVNGNPWASTSGNSDWTTNEFHLPWGVHTLRWQYAKDASRSFGDDTAWLDNLKYSPEPLFSPSTALDNYEQQFILAGNEPWFGQTRITTNNTPAIQSGPIDNNEASIITTAVQAPGTLAFDWKVSSEDGFDKLRVFFNDDKLGEISGNVDWRHEVFEVYPGIDTISWNYSKDSSTDRNMDAGWLDNIVYQQAPPVPIAVNNTNLTWQDAGALPWYSQTILTHDGAFAARSGRVGNSEASTLQTTISGPVTLSFYWGVSSESSYDKLQFLLDGELQDQISGHAFWQEKVYNLPTGEHVVAWNYTKDGSGSSGKDAGYLDEVRIFNNRIPITITGQPQDTSVNEGDSATLTVSARSDESIQYAWIKDGSRLTNNNRISGAHSDTLIIDNAQTSDAGIYRALLSHVGDEQYSQGAQLTVIPQGQDTNDDWSAHYVSIKDSPEAALDVRVGDIDNLNFGWPTGFNPFSGNSTPSHSFPWTPDPNDPQGTDRIMVVSSYDGAPPAGADGYTGTTSRPENEVQPIQLQYAVGDQEVTAAVLQMFVDDFQAPVWNVDYEVYLNGVRAPFLESMINALSQTGPVGKLITVRFPNEFLDIIASGHLEILIDDTTTGAGDGFAIDFVRLLINPLDISHTGTITGTVASATTEEPISGANVSAGGLVEATSNEQGEYQLNGVPAGLVIITVSKPGYLPQTKSIDLVADAEATTDFELSPIPALDIRRGASGSVVLSWPLSLSGFTLEKSLGLEPDITWNPVDTTPVQTNGAFEVHESVSNTNTFYRLIKP